MGILEKIAEIEREIGRTQKNKGSLNIDIVMKSRICVYNGICLSCPVTVIFKCRDRFMHKIYGSGAGLPNFSRPSLSVPWDKKLHWGKHMIIKRCLPDI